MGARSILTRQPRNYKVPRHERNDLVIYQIGNMPIQINGGSRESEAKVEEMGEMESDTSSGAVFVYLGWLMVTFHVAAAELEYIHGRACIKCSACLVCGSNGSSVTRWSVT